ncbi:MAG: hypothetical protein ACLU99_01080 [Alphaproteobacteria bacterium]
MATLKETVDFNIKRPKVKHGQVVIYKGKNQNNHLSNGKPISIFMKPMSGAPF